MQRINRIHKLGAILLVIGVCFIMWLSKGGANDISSGSANELQNLIENF